VNAVVCAALVPHLCHNWVLLDRIVGGDLTRVKPRPRRALVWSLVRPITQRSQVQILPPLPSSSRSEAVSGEIWEPPLLPCDRAVTADYPVTDLWVSSRATTFLDAHVQGLTDLDGIGPSLGTRLRLLSGPATQRSSTGLLQTERPRGERLRPRLPVRRRWCMTPLVANVARSDARTTQSQPDRPVLLRGPSAGSRDLHPHA